MDDLDECECGDYRKDHSHHGSCVFNVPQNTGHLGAPNCYGFRLFKEAPAAENHSALICSSDGNTAS